MNKSWVCTLGVASAVAAVACGAEPPSEEAGMLTEAAYGGPDLMWHEQRTGELNAWLLSGASVNGTQSLDTTCGRADGCQSNWRAFDGHGSSLWWHNWRSGEVASWSFGSDGRVTLGPTLSWVCGHDCSGPWHAVGMVNLKRQGCSGVSCQFPQLGVVWHDAWSGEVSVWLVKSDLRTVSGSVSLSQRCGASDSCPGFPMAAADFDGDRTTDLLWWDTEGGKLFVWLIQDTSGTVKGTQTISWRACPRATCRDWHIVDAGDANQDGHTDILWYNSETGTVSSWLLDGRGNVTGSLNLSWTVPPPHSWAPVGYVDFPASPPG